MTRQAQRRTKGFYAAFTMLLAALTVVAFAGIYYYKQADTYKKELHNRYMRAFHDMADYLNDIDVGIKKTMLANDASQLSVLSARLSMQSEAAKGCLAEIPTTDAGFDNTSKFLAQIGDYASYLSRKVIGNGEISEEEFQNLEKLSAYAEMVSEEFSKMEDAVYDNRMQVESLSWQKPFTVYADGESFADGMQRIETMPQEYPSLIYDGPFSEHLSSEEPKCLQGKSTISRLSAEGVVKQFLGEERAAKTHYESDGNGLIETYFFSGNTDGRNISIEITKQGGMVLWMLDDREVKEERLSVEQAMSRGETFLSQRGYTSMKSSYYDVVNHVATIHYAYEENGTVMYPDLIKVKVALDNGEIVGFESQGYIMCHRTREIPSSVITEEEAIKKAGSHILIDTVSTAYIPLDSKREVYCYELKGNMGKNNFLIYINAQTGQEEKILMLEESERGILTI